MPREWLKKIISSPSKTLIAFCVLFLGGVGVGSILPKQLVNWSEVGWYAGLFVLLASAILFWKNIKIRFIFLCLLFLIFGLWRVSVARFDCTKPNNICFYHDQKVNLVGKINKYPEEKIGSIEYVVNVKQAGVIGELGKVERKNVVGKILLRTSLANKFVYGDVVVFACFVNVPNNKEAQAFKYDRYLASRSIQAICGDARDIVALDKEGTDDNFNLITFLYKKIYLVRGIFANTASQIWGEPENSFINGLLFGGSSALPSYLQKSFQRTGLSHVLAVSGFNVTIIASVLMSILILIGLWRGQAFWITLFVLFCFVIMTGATASVVRAAIMGGLVLLAQYLGRLSSMGPALGFTAALMVLFSPYILFYDAGFQLSFLATIGLVYLAPVIKNVFVGWGVNPPAGGFAPSAILEILFQTLSAIIMTLPLMLYQFGLVSLVAPLVNVLLLWSVPWLMLGGFVTLLMGIIYLPLGNLFGVSVMIVSRVFLFVVEWFANLKFAAVEIKIEWWLMALLYVCLIYIIAKKRKSAV